MASSSYNLWLLVYPLHSTMVTLSKNASSPILLTISTTPITDPRITIGKQNIDIVVKPIYTKISTATWFRNSICTSSSILGLNLSSCEAWVTLTLSPVSATYPAIPSPMENLLNAIEYKAAILMTLPNLVPKWFFRH